MKPSSTEALLGLGHPGFHAVAKNEDHVIYRLAEAAVAEGRKVVWVSLNQNRAPSGCTWFDPYALLATPSFENTYLCVVDSDALDPFGDPLSRMNAIHNAKTARVSVRIAP